MTTPTQATQFTRAFKLPLLIALLASAPAVKADEERLLALEKRIQELEQKLAASLARQVEDFAPPADKPAETHLAVKQSPAVRGGEDAGYALVNDETGNELRFSAMVQLDSRVFLSDTGANGTALDDGFLLRRIRPTWSGKFAGVGFRIAPELSGNGTGANVALLDAFADVPSGQHAYFRLGKQKTAVSIDRLRVATALPLIERGLANELAPNRDLGVSWNSNFNDGKVQVVAGLFNGASDGRDVSVRDDAGKEIQARIFAEPFRTSDSVFKGLGVGISGTYGSKKNSQGNLANAANTLPRYRTAAQEEFFSYVNGVSASGTHRRLFPQFSWYRNNWGLVGEYGISEQELSRNGVEQSLRNTAYDLTLSWVPTGQTLNFRGVQLGKYPGAGAIELALRISGLQVDEDAFKGTGSARFADSDVSARQAQNFGAGVNWHINRNLKWSLDFNSTQFSGGGRNGSDREEEQLVSGRLQLVF